MPYDPKIHHRKSMRLKDYNYRWPGNYFITICTEDRRDVLGKVIDSQMILNLAGEMADKWLKELKNKFEDVALCHYAIMPNHIHAIISTSPVILSKENKKVETISKIVGAETVIVGADLCVRPERSREQMNLEPSIERTNYMQNNKIVSEAIRAKDDPSLNVKPYAQGGHTGPPLQSHEILCTSLSTIIQWFKTMSTNEYIKNVKQNNWKPFNKSFWQRNFYDCIIRNEKAYNNIRSYIYNNPASWNKDIENGEIFRIVPDKDRQKYYNEIAMVDYDNPKKSLG